MAAGALLLGAAVPAVAATSSPWAPASVGSPNAGYTTPADVALGAESCTNGTAGVWLQIPGSLIGDLDLAAGVHQQPPTWVIASGEGITKPASGDVCYTVDAVALDGQTYGTPGASDTWVELYASGDWKAPTVTDPTVQVVTANTPTSTTVTTAVYAVKQTTGGGVTVSTAPKQPTGSVATFEHAGTYSQAPSVGCASPDVWVARQFYAGYGQTGTTWVCVVPAKPTQTTTQTITQETSAPPPVVGLSGEGEYAGKYGPVCMGGPNNGQRVPTPPPTSGGVAAQVAYQTQALAWCKG